MSSVNSRLSLGLGCDQLMMLIWRIFGDEAGKFPSLACLWRSGRRANFKHQNNKKINEQIPLYCTQGYYILFHYGPTRHKDLILLGSLKLQIFRYTSTKADVGGEVIRGQ
jgi:hypothetical protein